MTFKSITCYVNMYNVFLVMFQMMHVSMTHHFQGVLGFQDSVILYLLKGLLIRLAQYALPHFDSAMTQLKITDKEGMT